VSEIRRGQSLNFDMTETHSMASGVQRRQAFGTGNAQTFVELVWTGPLCFGLMIGCVYMAMDSNISMAAALDLATLGT
jgi:hypothetical protein